MTNPIALPNLTGKQTTWFGLEGSAKALVIARLAQERENPILVIADSTRVANRLKREIHFFLATNDSIAGQPDIPVMHFPDWETLPYDLFSPHQDLISDRLRTLHTAAGLRKGVVLVSIQSMMHRLAPPAYVSGNSFMWRIGDSLGINALRGTLDDCGYIAVETVAEHGEYAVRGSIVDVFPMGSDQPLRIELFDDEIESLRYFDPDSQITTEKIVEIDLLPAREIDLSSQGIRRFKDNWHIRFSADPKSSSLYQDISRGIAAQGAEYYLPLFFDDTATLFDYLPPNLSVVTDGDIHGAANQYWEEIDHRFEEHNVDRTRPLLPPSDAFVPVPQLFEQLKGHDRIRVSDEHLDDTAGCAPVPTRKMPDVAIDSHLSNPLSKLQQVMEDSSPKVLFCAESAGRRDALEEILQRSGIRPDYVHCWNDFFDDDAPSVGITVFPIDRGLWLQEANLLLLTESELFGKRIAQKRRRQRAKDGASLAIQHLAELRIGAPVVHIDHGVGRYRGLQTLSVGELPQEFLTLEYAEEAKLYVPVSSLNLISRYSGSEDDLAPLHRLGSEKWQKAKDLAARQIRDTAAELLEVYAQRSATGGHSLTSDEHEYEAFCADFPFEETPDQLTAIEAVKADLAAEQPMDRLVCGDVGFGKTEVAMRAAFLAVSAGKQVVMLVPTTLLAHQHLENFRDRFSKWPIKIDELSRFRTAAEQQKVISDIGSGRIDILIGTHKILNARLNLSNLGLLIIDEEHRFGVGQKEKIKSLRANVDILTLTATPIPRTLNISMSGIRDLSIISTPPSRRLSVKTFVRQKEDRLVKEAVMRELLRGGQVYYLHNDVKSIDRAAEALRALVPEARVDIGHGQMRERDLEKIMSDFYHQRFNVLVCTTIIETGIDIPSANTIIIDRADKFGLAQLHQLRGRVGRSHHQAYAYLLTPDAAALSRDAEKRLEAIQAADQLGAGFMLATHDMEIRGAGELLGDQQSGQIQTIGFTLYMELLDRAVAALKSGKSLSTDFVTSPHDTEINLNIPALIPEEYLPDVHTRLVMYKRIANAASDDSLRELKVEMIDRFGLLPEEVKNLFRVSGMKIIAKAMGIESVEAHRNGGKLSFSAETTVDPVNLVQLVQGDPRTYRLVGASTLGFTQSLISVEDRFEAIQTLLDRLMSNPQTEH